MNQRQGGRSSQRGYRGGGHERDHGHREVHGHDGSQGYTIQVRTLPRQIFKRYQSDGVLDQIKEVRACQPDHPTMIVVFEDDTADTWGWLRSNDEYFCWQLEDDESEVHSEKAEEAAK